MLHAPAGPHKRGGGAVKVNIDETAVLTPEPAQSWLRMKRWRHSHRPLLARTKVVELRYFGGLSEEEIVEVL